MEIDVINIISLLFSLAAVAISFLSYRHAKLIKIADLQHDATRALAEIKSELCSLKDLHKTALRERKAVNAARGLLNSSATQKYEEKWNTDRGKIGRIESEISKIAEPDSRMSQAHLQTTVTDIAKIGVCVKELLNQYKDD